MAEQKNYRRAEPTKSQEEIDVSNLRFYADLFRRYEWQTDVLHSGVFISTLNGIAGRYAECARERDELKAALNTPETEDFFKGVELEAAHQRLRWPSELDAGKTHADWFWLVGYLAGKCLHAAIAGNTEKALHHTISTAAALANWHRAIQGVGNMRPGIDTPAEEATR